MTYPPGIDGMEAAGGRVAQSGSSNAMAVRPGSVTFAGGAVVWQNQAAGVPMNSDEREDNTIYKVVVNSEEQYSIWPADRDNPLGWKDAGKSGTKAECLDYVKEVWTDMRPLSLRKKMQEMGYP